MRRLSPFNKDHHAKAPGFMVVRLRIGITARISDRCPYDSVPRLRKRKTYWMGAKEGIPVRQMTTRYPPPWSVITDVDKPYALVERKPIAPRQRLRLFPAFLHKTKDDHYIGWIMLYHDDPEQARWSHRIRKIPFSAVVWQGRRLPNPAFKKRESKRLFRSKEGNDHGRTARLLRNHWRNFPYKKRKAIKKMSETKKRNWRTNPKRLAMRKKNVETNNDEG